MKYKILGKTGLLVSEVCMGTMTFGSDASKEESIKMFQLCRDNGINFFDCANKYSDGEAEKILGECSKNCRDEIILTTKGTSRVGKEINDLGSSRKHLMLEVEKSLKRLDTEYIDIYFIHYFDDVTSMASTLRFLDDIVRQGKVLYTGLSNWAAWQIMKSIHISEMNNFASIDCIQPMYSLIKRQAEVEILPLARDQRLGVLSYSPLGSGVLTGKYADISTSQPARLTDKDYYNKRYKDPHYFQVAQKLKDFAEKSGYDPSPLAISWAMNHPAVTSVIIGARNSEQLNSSLKAIDINMTDELRQDISGLSATPSPAHDRLEEIMDEKTRLR